MSSMITADSSEGSMGMEEVKSARVSTNGRSKSRGGKSIDPERRSGSSVFSRLSQIFSFGKSGTSLKNGGEPKAEVIRRGTLREVKFKVTAWESDSGEDDEKREDDGQASDDQ